MKKRIFLFVTILMLISGVGILLYPVISNWIAVYFRELEIKDYSASVEKMNPEFMDEEIKKAKEFNDALTGSGIEDPFIPGSGIVLPDNYLSILNIEGTIGYIRIPKINVYLPIYHGTSEEVLQKGVGHLEKTAFPIGGKGNHAVLTGHTGLASAKLFTDLKELVEGDIFHITILEQVLTYEVDRILVIEPTNTENLRPVTEEDYVTLVTCTPYGINSHRLLVRGRNITKEDEEIIDVVETGTIRWSGWQTEYLIIPIVGFAVMVNIILFVRKRRKWKKKRRQEGDDEKKYR